MNTHVVSPVTTAPFLIRVVSSQYESEEEANDALAGASALPGYVFGYVDSKERRTVTFHEDAHPGSLLPINRGMTRVPVLAKLQGSTGNYSESPVESDAVDAARYRRLRAIMGLNMASSWKAVERLAAIACYVGTDAFDGYLDINMGESPEVWNQMEAD